MNPQDKGQHGTSDHNPDARQVDDKPAKRVRTRSGEGTVAFWRARLFRNTYTAKDGSRIEIPEWYARMRHGGVTKRVRLHNSDKDKAADEALQLSGSLAADGWAAVLNGQARLPASPTIAQYCTLYSEATASMESPIRPRSLAAYTLCLARLCSVGGIKTLRELTREAIETARDKYRARARAEGRPDSAIQNSISSILRNAAACFSREAREVLARRGLKVKNPFIGVRRAVRIEPVTPLSREIVDRVWTDLPTLRDGDPTTKAPRGAKAKARYVFDFRKPRPDAYAAVILAFAAGLRANEIDKARWNWLKFDRQGDCFLEVHEESDFRPKGGTARLIKIPRELHDSLAGARVDKVSPYILGGQPKASGAKALGYRCEDALRAANAWLRARGLEAGKANGNCLHRLRKQFGSEVATTFGLFHAQRLLGHSTPTVTSQYYAGQTELPTLTHVRLAG